MDDPLTQHKNKIGVNFNKYVDCFNETVFITFLNLNSSSILRTTVTGSHIYILF